MPASSFASRRSAANEDLLDVASRAPVIKLVNLLLFEAVQRRASDVHVQPYDARLVVRFRIDGVLHDVYQPPKALQEEILSRIKVMGGMNIAERRLAQDGRATVEVGDRIVDLRIATLPTSFGERAVIRLLDKSVRLYELAELGMPEDVLTPFRQLIRKDHGILLVTGPTGSGKSTTAASAPTAADRMPPRTTRPPPGGCRRPRSRAGPTSTAPAARPASGPASWSASGCSNC
jgi:general secretion pathway protein E